jgi:hypothetical protein
MKINILTFFMYVVTFTSFILSFYYLGSMPYLSISLLSGSLFFWFLSQNPKLLVASTLNEIDRLIPNLKGKTYMLGSFILLIVGFVMT